MASKAAGSAKRGAPWRIIGWGSAVAMLAIPFAAMQFTREVNWSLGDFVVAGLLIASVGAAFEFAAAKSSNRGYRAGAALALLAAVLVIWTNLAVGIVGSEHNPGNLLFFGALLVGIVGAAIARFRAKGTARAMIATAVSLGIAFVIAAMAPTDEPNVSHWLELAGTTVFAALFVASAALFRRASRV